MEESASRWLAAVPWLILLGVCGPLWLLARRGRVHPHRGLLAALVVPTVLTLGVLVRSEFLLLVLVLDALVVALAAADLFSLPRVDDFQAERATVKVASLATPHRVMLTIDNRTARSWRVTVRDDVPDEMSAEPPEFPTTLTPRSHSTLHYVLRAQRRGRFSLGCLHLEVLSRLGLWRRLLRLPAASELHVYPDLDQLQKYAVLARTNRLSLIGVRRTRRVGEDHDFERLRDYARDDNYKHIDWRATARRNKLTVKDFQTSQSQRIVFLLDCGRMMTGERDGLSMLDHALNALLMLSFVALRQHDNVGLVCFSDRIHSFVPPRSGGSQMNRLLHATFNLFPTMVESRYDLAFLHLATNCRKRSLVVVITNLIDDVNATQVRDYLSVQTGRHLPLAVLLRDRQLFAAVEPPEPAGTQLFRAAAAAGILSWRQQWLHDLERRGVLMLDAFPESLTAPLVNRYLEIKARHLL